MLTKCMIVGLIVGCFCSASFVRAAQKTKAPSYPIATDAYTTLDKTVGALPHGTNSLLPYQVSEYATNHYGEWNPNLAGFPFVKPEMTVDTNWPTSTDPSLTVPSVPDPSAKTLLTFFTMSDVHICDKESPAQAIFYGYELGPLANSSAYSPVILDTTHVLDAAVQTINALHKESPFDFGIALGDAINNNQYNELRWYIDVLDGKKITPSSGAHKGARTIDYQKPYQAAGLDKSIPWYQAIGNHDQFWMGSALSDDNIHKILVGSRILNLGMVPPGQPGAMDSRGFYTGILDGTTKYGDVIDAGPVADFPKPPKIAADRKRHALTVSGWMAEFFKTTSNPVGHGFTKEMLQDGFACYSFHPKTNMPIKVIVLDDTDKAGSAGIALDYQRYNWLVSELDAGEAAGELMIVCAHIPVRPYTQVPQTAGNPLAPFMTTTMSYATITEQTLLNKLWTYQNLIMWVSGHVHRNAITPQPPQAPSPYVGDLTHGFWEVETPSLRDFPQEFRRFEICRNSDNTISIFALDVDTAINPALLSDGEPSPAWTSRSYAVATQQIFDNHVQQGPNVGATNGVYNAELVKHLSPAMQAKIALIPAP
jgi:metallophosphoesterase (TIGR03768 family)